MSRLLKYQTKATLDKKNNNNIAVKSMTLCDNKKMQKKSPESSANASNESDSSSDSEASSGELSDEERITNKEETVQSILSNLGQKNSSNINANRSMRSCDNKNMQETSTESSANASNETDTSSDSEEISDEERIPNNEESVQSNLVLDEIQENVNSLIKSLEDSTVDNPKFTDEKQADVREMEPKNIDKTNIIQKKLFRDDNLNSKNQKEIINDKNTNLSLQISVLCDNISKDEANHQNIFTPMVNNHRETTSCPPPVPVRAKFSGKETPPPQRPQRKRSLEQRNRESVERTRYIPKQERLKDLENIKKEFITTHQLPKVQKIEIKNLNTNDSNNEKECQIQ